MKKKDLKNLVDNKYKEQLKLIGFEKKGKEFIKSLEDFTYTFSYVIYDYGNVYIPHFSYGLKSKTYSLLGSIINEEQLDPFVYHIRQGTLFENGKYPVNDYLITSLNQVEGMINEVITYFKSQALPYLESISNLKIIEELTYKNPKQPTDSFQGLILAKLLGSKRYEELKMIYRDFYAETEWGILEDIQKFESLILYLDKHTKEELEKIAS